MSFLRKTHIENAKKKEANNQDEISKKKPSEAREQKKTVSICNFRVYNILKFMCYPM